MSAEDEDKQREARQQEEDKQLREEQRRQFELERFAEDINTFPGRWLGTQVTQAPDGGLFIDVVPAVTNDDRGDASPPNPEKWRELQEGVAKGMAGAFGVQAPTTADGAPDGSESPSNRIYVPPEKVDEVIAIVNDGRKARNPGVGVRQDEHGHTIVQGITKDENGQIIDPVPTGALNKAVQEAREDALDIAPSQNDPERVNAYLERKKGEIKQSEARIAQIEYETAIRHEQRARELQATLGFPSEEDRKVGENPGNEKKFALERMFIEDMKKAGKLNDKGEVDWQKVKPRDTFAAIDRKCKSEHGGMWRSPEEVERVMAAQAKAQPPQTQTGQTEDSHTPKPNEFRQAREDTSEIIYQYRKLTGMPWEEGNDKMRSVEAEISRPKIMENKANWEAKLAAAEEYKKTYYEKMKEGGADVGEAAQAWYKEIADEKSPIGKLARGDMSADEIKTAQAEMNKQPAKEMVAQMRDKTARDIIASEASTGHAKAMGTVAVSHEEGRTQDGRSAVLVHYKNGETVAFDTRGDEIAKGVVVTTKGEGEQKTPQKYQVAEHGMASPVAPANVMVADNKGQGQGQGR